MGKLLLFTLIAAISFLNVSAQNIQVASSSGSGLENGGAMTADAHGNIYCFGTFTDTLKILNAPAQFSNGNYDCYVAKFNRYMQIQWIKTIGSSGAEGAGDIAYYNGKLYLCGWYGAQTIINNDTLIYNFDCLSPGFVAMLDTSGNFLSSKSFTQTSNSINCFINDIEVNKSGVSIAGKIKGQFYFGNNQYVLTNPTFTDHDIFIARFDTSFNCIFALKGSSVLGAQIGEDGASCLQMDTLGNIYVGGFFGSLPNLGNATLYFGSQTATANGGYGFADYFIAKVRANGAVAWLRASGGSLPDVTSKLCLENNSKIAVVGRYSDNSNIGGAALPPSINEYSTYFGTIDSSGNGLTAYRISNEAQWLSLKKGNDNYLYGADLNLTMPSARFKFYKLQIDTGIIAKDSITILHSNINGDLLPPSLNCGEITFNCSFNQIVKYSGDTLISNNYNQNTYDFCFGKYSFNNSFLMTPQITTPVTNTICSNSPDIAIVATVINNASNYHWTLLPNNAGTIINNGNTIFFDVDSGYSGLVQLVCYVSNFCDISASSDTLDLMILQAPVIYSIVDQTSYIEVNLNFQDTYDWYYNNTLLPLSNAPSISCLGSGTYTVIASNQSCSDTLSSNISCVISSDKHVESENVNIFPNPAKGNLHINTNTEELKTITIYNITGDLLACYSFSGKQFNLRLDDLSKGSYLIAVQTNSDIFHKHLIME